MVKTHNNTREPDTISIAAGVTCDAHTRGDLSQDALIDILERLIDARARSNGYAEQYGLPSQQDRLVTHRP